MGSMSGKYSEGKMRDVSGKVDSGSAMGDKQIVPGITGDGGGDVKKGVESPQTSSKKQIPPMNASPKGPPIAD